MPIELVITLAAVFASIALVSGSVASLVLSRTAPEVKRLRQAAKVAEGPPGPSALTFSEEPPLASLASKPLRKPTEDGSKLRRRLASVGLEDPSAPQVYKVSQVGLAVLLGLVPVIGLGLSTGWPVALVTAILGYMIPDVMVSRWIAQHKRAIQAGLPDTLDLLVVCVEAGSSLDQAILRASSELELAVPAMATELRTVATEIRAGKARLDAFQDFAKRTKVDDVRALVAMLIQTDRFGTSIAQALRTHAETVRTKRRQNAEERAGKVGVKLVFPLVLCLLPALYVVCLGPVAVRMYRALF